MKKQAGFTLIELIIVIVILGILAVTAAPQFFNFGGDARSSTVRGMEGSVKAAADLVYARSAIEGEERDETGQVSVGGADVDTAFGYPTAASLENALNVSAGDWTFSVDDDTVRITPQGRDAVTDGGDACQVEYVQSASENARPTVTVNTEAC